MLENVRESIGSRVLREIRFRQRRHVPETDRLPVLSFTPSLYRRPRATKSSSRFETFGKFKRHFDHSRVGWPAVSDYGLNDFTRPYTTYLLREIKRTHLYRKRSGIAFRSIQWTISGHTDILRNYKTTIHSNIIISPSLNTISGHVSQQTKRSLPSNSVRPCYTQYRKPSSFRKFLP